VAYADDIARFQQQALQRQQADYERQVQAFRQQRAQEDYEVDLNQLRYGAQEALARRQEIEQQAARTSDPDERQYLMNEWHAADGEFLSCSRELQQKMPQQQQQMSPAAQQWVREHATCG